MKKVFLSILIFSTMFSVLLSTDLKEILSGVEATVYAEFGVPDIVWINQMDAEGSAGYDVTGKKVNFQGSMGLRVFDNLKVSVSASVDTDFSTQTDYKFGLGMNYKFSSENSGTLRFLEAKKESMNRKIKVIEIFFDYFNLKSELNSNNSSNDSISFMNKSLNEVEIAYLLTQIEAYSSIDNLNPEFGFEFGYVPANMETDTVDLAVLNYLETNKDREIDTDGIYAFMRSDNEKLKNVISGGLGGTFKFDIKEDETTDDKLQEINIRRMKLRHDVICQNIPLLIEEIRELKKLKNTLTKDFVQGNIESSQINELNRRINVAENGYFSFVIESFKIKYIFDVMRGELQ